MICSEAARPFDPFPRNLNLRVRLLTGGQGESAAVQQAFQVSVCQVSTGQRDLVFAAISGTHRSVELDGDITAQVDAIEGILTGAAALLQLRLADCRGIAITRVGRKGAGTPTCLPVTAVRTLFTPS